MASGGIPALKLPRGHAAANSPRIRGRVQTGAANVGGMTPVELVSARKSPLTRPDMGLLPEPVPTMAVPPDPGTDDKGRRRQPDEPLSKPKVRGGANNQASTRIGGHLKHGQTVDGHVEAVLTTMREFFQTRPYSVLLEVFRQQDVDISGTIEKDEFKGALKALNLNLTDRDLEAVFKVCDSDNSGVLEFSEFFNNFRTDRFPRNEFFWSSQRPHALLKPEERPELLAKMAADRKGMAAVRSPEEIIEMLGSQVFKAGPKLVFNAMDESRDGALNPETMAQALNRYGLACGAEEVGGQPLRVRTDPYS